MGKMKELLGSEYQVYIDSFDAEWQPGLRANTMKITPQALRELLPWPLETVPWCKEGFYYDPGEARPSKDPAYYAGLYYLQEPSAMTPGAFLPVEPGDRVLDVCAAPGGKSTQLGARLEGRGLLVANDISPSRARALLKNLELAGIPNICVTGETPERLAGQWPEFFDKILVDAPCSGEGMFRRDEDMVRDWSRRGPAYYSPLQREILFDAVRLLKPGGLLLYSTCTFSKEEDEGAVQAALDQFPELELCPLDQGLVPGACSFKELPGCLRLFPHRLKGEGHFLALLRKKAGSGCAGGSAGEVPNGRTRGCAGEGPKDCARALGRETGEYPASYVPGRGRKVLETQPELAQFLKLVKLPVDPERIMVRQNLAYLLPEGITDSVPLRFLRTGLLLGEIKKGRFEPSQALAMALKPGQFPCVLRLSIGDERVVRYLKGETVSLTEGEAAVKGWCLVCMDEYPLGWAKGAGRNLKNKYYPGWRWQ